MVPVEILLNFGNYFRTLQLGFENFFQELFFFITKYALHIGLFFLQTHSIWNIFSIWIINIWFDIVHNFCLEFAKYGHWKSEWPLCHSFYHIRLTFYRSSRKAWLWSRLLLFILLFFFPLFLVGKIKGK